MFFHSYLGKHVFMDLDLCTEALSYVATVWGKLTYGHEGQMSSGHIVYKCAIIIAFLSQDLLWDVQRLKGHQ